MSVSVFFCSSRQFSGLSDPPQSNHKIQMGITLQPRGVLTSSFQIWKALDVKFPLVVSDVKFRERFARYRGQKQGSQNGDHHRQSTERHFTTTLSFLFFSSRKIVCHRFMELFRHFHRKWNVISQEVSSTLEWKRVERFWKEGVPKTGNVTRKARCAWQDAFVMGDGDDRIQNSQIEETYGRDK